MLTLALLMGCPPPLDYRPADLQIDLPGQVPAEAETVRICIEDVGSRSFGAKLAGRFAMTGVPTDVAVDVVIDVLDADGELMVQGYADGVDGWIEGELEEECEDCTLCGATGSFAAPGEESWVLAIRFEP